MMQDYARIRREIDEYEFLKTGGRTQAEQDHADNNPTTPYSCCQVVQRMGSTSKGFLVYLDPELLHQVKTVALAERKTLQQIGVEALEALVASRED